MFRKLESVALSVRIVMQLVGGEISRWEIYIESGHYFKRKVFLDEMKCFCRCLT